MLKKKDISLAGRSKIMDSNHMKRLAVDFNLFIDSEVIWSLTPEWEDLGVYWEVIRSENKWGGHYKSLLDLLHFERVG